MRGETVPFFMKGYKKALPPLEGKGFEGGARELSARLPTKGLQQSLWTQKEKPNRFLSQTLGVLN